MKLKAILFIITVFLISTSQIFANSLEMQMQEANKHFMAKEYDRAITLYQGIEQAGYISKALFYNMGSAHYLSGKLPESVYYYEKTLKYYPQEQRAKENLNLLKQEMNIDIIEVPDFILIRIWKETSQILSPKSWFILEFFMALVSIYLVYLWQYSNNSKDKVRYFTMALSVMFIFLIVNCLGFTAEAQLHSEEEAVVMDSTVLYSGADKRSTALRDVKAGTHLDILDGVEDWFKVVLDNKEQGWMSASSIRKL